MNKLNSRRPSYWPFWHSVIAVLVLLVAISGCSTLVRQPPEAQSNQFRKYTASDIERLFKARKLLPADERFIEFKPWIKEMRPRAQYNNKRVFPFFRTTKGRISASVTEYSDKRTMSRYLKTLRKSELALRPRDRSYVLIKDNILVLISNYNNSFPAAEAEKFRQALKSLR